MHARPPALATAFVALGAALLTLAVLAISHTRL